jgi:hypothetical protein
MVADNERLDMLINPNLDSQSGSYYVSLII